MKNKKIRKSISGKTASQILNTLHEHCDLRAKDNTNKMWCYKLKTGEHREFAFDPRTTSRLILRLDVKPPNIPGLKNPEDIEMKPKSTALHRVFSGGNHSAKWKIEVEDESALIRLIEYLGKAT